MSVKELFRRFAHSTSRIVGSAWSFIVAFGVIVVWAFSGPLFGFSDTWQLVINTGTTIVTFLMVFLIQNTQNRDATAIHLKLDELLRGVHGARTGLVGLESLSDEDLARIHGQFDEIREAREHRDGKPAAPPPPVDTEDEPRTAAATANAARSPD